MGRQQGNALLNLLISLLGRRKGRAGTKGHPSPASGGRQGRSAPAVFLLCLESREGISLTSHSSNKTLLILCISQRGHPVLPK